MNHRGAHAAAPKQEAGHLFDGSCQIVNVVQRNGYHDVRAAVGYRRSAASAE
jgi:hypothetical protein